MVRQVQNCLQKFEKRTKNKFLFIMFLKSALSLNIDITPFYKYHLYYFTLYSDLMQRRFKIIWKKKGICANKRLFMVQNKIGGVKREKKNSKSILNGKGFYIALALSVAMVGAKACYFCIYSDGKRYSRSA